mgnify:CR=1 FL=1
MKFAHVRASGHFTFAEQIFHRKAISLARKGKFRCVPALWQVRRRSLFLYFRFKSGHKFKFKEISLMLSVYYFFFIFIFNFARTDIFIEFGISKA